jgi:hypothetical protein
MEKSPLQRIKDEASAMILNDPELADQMNRLIVEAFDAGAHAVSEMYAELNKS